MKNIYFHQLTEIEDETEKTIINEFKNISDIEIKIFSKDQKNDFLPLNYELNDKCILLIPTFFDTSNCLSYDGVEFAFYWYFHLINKNFPFALVLLGTESKSAFFQHSNYSNFLKCPNVYYVDYNINSIQVFLSRISFKNFKSKDMLENLKNINIKPPTSYKSHHTISNEWAIYRWAHAIGASDNDIEKIENKVENNFYFKYLQAIYPITEIPKIGEDQLRIDNLKDAKILYIDDEADKGWYEVMFTIIAGVNKVKDFDYLGNELKNKTQNEIIDLSIKKIKEYDAEIIILDFRLHDNDFDCNIKEVTGYKILQAIKEINPGIQVIMFSATNKVWNLQALQDAGADGFIMKESPENSVDSNFTQEVIISFIQELDKANKRRFLKEFWIKLNDLKIKSSKFDNEILIAWKLLYDSFTNQKYFNYAYLQLFLIIETFLTDENVFRKNIEGSNYVICKNGEESLVFDFIKYVNNQPKYKSAIKFRNGNYKKEIDNNFNRRLDTNAIISSILIFRYGLETSGEKNWTNIYDTRNSKAAHPEKGIVTIQELIILINFIIFLLESENLNNKNYNFSLIKPTFEESIEKLRVKFS